MIPYPFAYHLVLKTTLANIFIVFTHFSNASALNNYILDKKVVTESLLKDLDYLRRVTAKLCTLRLYTNLKISTNDTTAILLNLQIFFDNYEPSEIFQNNPENLQRHAPGHKFRSSCWNSVFTITDFSDGLILDEKLLGNTIHDQFIFVGANEFILEQVLLRSHVLDKVYIKHGIYLNKGQVKYLVEPKIYTGTFLKSLHLQVSKVLNNLNGRTVQIPLFNIKPTVVIVHDHKGNITGIRGSHYKFTMETAHRTNFTPNFYKEFTAIGKSLENGTWTGFIGAVVTGIGEFSPISAVLLDRYDWMAFLTLTYREPMIFCVKEPEPILHWQALVFPLSKIVWVFTLSSFAGFMFLFALIVSCKLLRKKYLGFNIPVFLQEGIFLPFALFLEQNVSVPTQPPARVAAIFLIWLAFVIGTVYKTNLVGFITFPEKQPIPRSFKELHEHKEYTINLFSLANSLEMKILESSPMPVFKGIVKRVKQTRSVEGCLKSATKDRTACIFWKHIGMAELMKSLSTFPELRTLYFTQDTASAVDITAAVKKHSIYYETFNRYAGATKEGGLFTKWIRDEMAYERELAEKNASKTGKVENDKESDKEADINAINEQLDEEDGQQESENSAMAFGGGAKPLAIKHLMAVAYAFEFGCIVSFICLAMEFLIRVITYYSNRFNVVVDFKISQFT